VSDEERCERTGLLPAHCAHCRPASNIERPYRRPSGRNAVRQGHPFPAKYEGECPRCEDPIIVGESIRRTRDGFVHEGCDAQ
jgi:hypothetical protein